MNSVWSNGHMCQQEEMRTAVSSFYNDVIDNIRFAKQQQWRVTNYVSLVYAALFALNLQIEDPTHFEMTGLTVLTLLATILGSCVLWSLRNWLCRLEERLNAIYRTYFSKEEQKNLSINPDRPRTRHDLVSSIFIAIIFLGAAVVLYFIWDYPLNADDGVLTALTLEAQRAGDQLQQVVSRPDQGAVVAHPCTLADIERIRNGGFTECEAAAVAHLPSRILSQKGTFVRQSLRG